MQREPTKTKLLRSQYKKMLLKRFIEFRNNVINRCSIEIEKMYNQLSNLSLKDITDIIDEEIYFSIENNLRNDVNKYIFVTYRRGINRAVNQLTIDDKSLISDFITPLDKQAIELLTESNVTFVLDAANNCKKAIIYEIQRGLLVGESVKNISDNIYERVDDLSKNACERIARTEIIRAYNTALYNKYSQAGIEKYEWITAYDERSCEDCMAYDGKIFSIEDREYPPLHPNCRCCIAPIVKGD